MPALPVPATDELKLADWLELLAIEAADKNASLGDLERALRRGSVLEAADDQRSQEAVAEKLIQVGREVSDRAGGAGEGYPFTFDGRTLYWCGIEPQYTPYLFCLLLTNVVPTLSKKNQVFPRRAFEDLSCAAAGAYVGGESVRFASPRTDLPRHFGKAVTVVCTSLGEGQEFKDQPSLDSKDATLDVVAWKHFPDRLPGKLVLFGQCASGNDWNSKLGALRPDSFCAQWMLEVPPSAVIRAFFIPHRVSSGRWNWVTRQAGIVFDRCRIAHWTNSLDLAGTLQQMHDWVQKLLNTLSKREAAA